jgi:hypothetical protein
MFWLLSRYENGYSLFTGKSLLYTADPTTALARMFSPRIKAAPMAGWL